MVKFDSNLNLIKFMNLFWIYERWEKELVAYKFSGTILFTDP